MVLSFFPVAILRPFLVVEHHFPRPHQKRGLDGAWGVSSTGSAFFQCVHIPRRSLQRLLAYACH